MSAPQSVPDLNQIFYWLGLGFGAGLGLPLVLYIKRKISELFNGKKNKKSIILTRDMEIYNEVRDDCIRVLERLDCDRVSIVQFHNGERFFGANQIFKMTCTVEVFDHGVGPCSDQLQELHMTYFLPVILPLLGSKQDVEGVSIVKKLDSEGDECSVVVIERDKLPEGTIKNLMNSSGTSLWVLSPIKDFFGGYIGFVNAQWLDKSGVSLDTLPDNIYKVFHLSLSTGNNIMSLHPTAADSFSRRPTAGMLKNNLGK